MSDATIMFLAHVYFIFMVGFGGYCIGRFSGEVKGYQKGADDITNLVVGMFKKP